MDKGTCAVDFCSAEFPRSPPRSAEFPNSAAALYREFATRIVAKRQNVMCEFF